MKRLFFAAALLFAASGAVAQNTSFMARTGVFEKDGEVIVENPITTLDVGLKVEKEEILCGPYARYAQKYLGVRAPLTDKTTYTLTGAFVGFGNDIKESMTTPLPAPKPVVTALSHKGSETEFARLQPDKISITPLALEDAAREAATTIFSLRKHRLELITGEAGEHVFGAGLEAALAEIDRLEQAYLELFLGKRVVTTSTTRKLITPYEDTRQMILCRFSTEQGILPQDDLSGEIVLIQFEPSSNMPCPYEAVRKNQITVTYRIAGSTHCIVLYGNRVLGENSLPVFQFGRTANVAVPGKK